ncbi:MAG: excinuclease ABC subunit UvrC [Actinomycetota bacterium]
MRMSQNWQPATSAIPDSPGVYLFRDGAGRVIYVGKAKSLKQRIPSYFGTGLHPRTLSMTGAAAEVEWIVTRNEVEALQLEVTLIKQHQTRFNVKYRDDKSYPYLSVSFSEQIPRAKVTRGKRNRQDRYYGPYAHAYAIRETLDLLLRVFPLRSCSKGVFDRAARSNRPCLLYHIGRCSAPCSGIVSPQQHLQIVHDFCAFMDGNHDKVIADLQARMTGASESMEYEAAARWRDQLSAVKKVVEKQQMVGEHREDYDMIAFHGDVLEAAFQTFFVRGGRVVGRKGFIVDKVEPLDDPELVHSFIESTYAEEPQIPKVILVGRNPASPEVLQQWLSQKRGSLVRIAVPQRGAKRRLMETVQRNAQEAFERHRLKRATDFASRARALNDLQEQLGLPEAPLRIECFDISNLGPTDVVGSMVVFEDGLPKKSEYRKFRVGGVEGQDDFASIGEVIGRRFARLLKEQDQPPEKGARFAYRPGLVVVDGGKGQLNRAVLTMRELGITDVAVVSLAKRLEEVYLPGRSDPVILPRGSEALYLMQRMRDEAHRFAITFQRDTRRQRMTLSALDALPGVGPARRKALLRHFGSPAGVQRATAEQICEVPGIGPALAARIHNQLRSAV